MMQDIDTASEPLCLAKLTWRDPKTGKDREYVLVEGATATIGRHEDNDISISEARVSRRHSVVAYRHGIFTIADLGSANGTFVNGERIDGVFPLVAGDEIRLHVPTLVFSATVADEERQSAHDHSTLILPTGRTGLARLVLTNGPQEGETLLLKRTQITLGRAVPNAPWDIGIQDTAVSRPHARIDLIDGPTWVIYDLGSANGTVINGTLVTEKGRALRDGDVLTLGTTIALFREG